MGKLLGISTRTKRKAPMDLHTEAAVTFEKGVAEDSRGIYRGKRQVTVLSSEAWQEACADLGKEIPWITRRANFLIDGIRLQGTKGKKLKVGTCLLEITGELEPCNRMDEQFEGLTDILSIDWRGGVTCKILAEGEVSVGSEVCLLD